MITQEGELFYKKVGSKGTTTFNGPIKGFNSNNLEFGRGVLSTTLVVNKPPDKTGEVWKMEVDGAELTKTTE